MQNLKKKLKPPKLSCYEVNLTLDGLTGSGTTADGLTTGTCLEWPVNEQINETKNKIRRYITKKAINNCISWTVPLTVW